jgi:transcription antitermination factor NusG
MVFYDGNSWLALQVTPRHENSVDRMLGVAGHDHFLPLRNVRRRWSDRTKVSELPLFPGYVFCKIRDSLMKVVRSIPGTIRVVSFGGKPYPVAEEDIAALQRLVQSDRDVTPVPYLQVGRKVKVVFGPLAGVMGIITQLKKRDRLIISLDFIMKSVSVEIDCSEVALLPYAAETTQQKK